MLQMFQEKKNSPTRSPRKSPARGKVRFDLGGNKVLFISLGCPRNLVDTEVMLGILLKNGYEATHSLPDADHIVINTCGFLESSRQESLSNIKEAIRDKKQGAKVIVTGCMVQKYSDQIKSDAPEVDYLLGSGDVESILKAVQSEEQGVNITDARSYLEAGEIPRVLSTPQHFAYLKIAEGCRKRCAYCVIPDIKGPLKSKPEERVLKEFQILLNQGVKEIILIAQDLGDWGKDNGFKRSEGLIHLLKQMLAIEGDYWLRLLYLYPDEITDELITLIKSDSRICPYLDMPIQHVNNAVLKSMHRATSKEQIVDILTKLRREIPGMHVRTSLIVGYPGESEEQFEELAAFLQEHPIDHVGIFPFSKEPGSRAADLPDQIPEEVKQRRLQTLMEIQQKIVLERKRAMIGKTLVAIVESYHPETELLMVARHQGQCPDIDSQVLINDGRKVNAFGQRYQVKITDVSGYDLIGKVIK